MSAILHTCLLLLITRQKVKKSVCGTGIFFDFETWYLIHHFTQFLTEITLSQQITYENIYPFPIRNLGAVVAVRKCSPSGDQ